MIPAWYKRMNPRERVLAWIVGGTAIVLLNLVILSWLFSALGRARTELAARKTARAEQAIYVKEQDLWIKRDQWIQQHQPMLKNPAEASVLLDQLKQGAAKNNVLIQNPAIGSGETTPNHQTMFAYTDFDLHPFRHDHWPGGRRSSATFQLRSLLSDGESLAVRNCHRDRVAFGDSRFCKRSLRRQCRAFAGRRPGYHCFEFGSEFQKVC